MDGFCRRTVKCYRKLSGIAFGSNVSFIGTTNKNGYNIIMLLHEFSADPLWVLELHQFEFQKVFLFDSDP